MIIDDTSYNICITQKEIYEYANDNHYDIESFSNAYLKSDFCKRAFDTIYSRFQFADAEECMDFIIPEIKPLIHINENQNPYAGDIGFMYRLLYIMTSIPSAEIIELIPFAEMAKAALRFDYDGYEESAEYLVNKYALPLKPYNSEIL